MSCHRTILSLLLLVVLVGCGKPFWLPEAHKIDIQQGNLISAEQLDQLRTGMSRQEVRALLGDPVLSNSLDTQRWDYLYTRGIAGEHVRATGLTVFFNGNTVSKIENHIEADQDS